MASTVGGSLTRAFDAAPSTVPRARHAVMATLIDAGCGIDTIETAALLTTELVANVVQHAAGGAYEVDVDVRPSVVHVAVRDGDRRLPLCALREPIDADQGRGLSIVERFSTRWGARTDDQGKTVWFELAVAP